MGYADSHDSILESVSDNTSTSPSTSTPNIDIDIPSLKSEAINHAAGAVVSSLYMHRFSSNVSLVGLFAQRRELHGYITQSWGDRVGGENEGLRGQLISLLELEERMTW
jgi:hypothetical protein